jgi:NADPH:quinone reductase-like Zn-dependent oxidoreductase
MNVHTMRAAVIASFGSIDSLTVTSVPRPIPRAGEVLLRISAIGINPVDWKTVEGAGVASQVTSFPFTPGLGRCRYGRRIRAGACHVQTR